MSEMEGHSGVRGWGVGCGEGEGGEHPFNEDIPLVVFMLPCFYLHTRWELPWAIQVSVVSLLLCPLFV